MYRVLVTGGAGYVGSVLVEHLLDLKHKVTVVDDLIYENGYAIMNFIKREGFSFVKGDIRDETLMREIVRNQDFVVHLAAVVGFPACEKNPQLAQTTNYEGTRLISSLLSRQQGLLFASTGSNYGCVVGQICTEETPLNPLSLYGKTKTQAERCVMENNSAVVYRFATAFGVSPRMRLDLLINDFVYETVVNQYLIMFEKDFKRTFIHVDDMARGFAFAIEHFDLMQGNVYNVGGETNDYSKEEIAIMIGKEVKFYLHFANVGEDMDKRNYEVSYSKINKVGFCTERTVANGISELIRAVPALDHRGKYRNV